MNSRSNTPNVFVKRLRYWRERFGNAIWMLRTGRFKLFFQSIYIELYPTVELVRAQLQMEDREVSGSAFVDKRKVEHLGFRPTVAQRSSGTLDPAKAQIVATELSQILSTLAIKEESIS